MVLTQDTILPKNSEKLMENARQTLDVLVDVKGELSAWVEKSVQSASSNLPKVPTKK